MAGSPIDQRDALEQPFRAQTCPACGAKVREDRVRCLRCGTDLAARAAGGRAAASSPILWLPAVAVCAAVLGLVLSGLVQRRSAGPAAAIPPFSSAIATPPLPSSVGSSVTPPAPFATPATAADSTRLGASAYDLGKIEESLAHFQDVVTRTPDDPEALNNLGQLLVRSGKPAEAVPYFDRAILLKADTWAYQFNRARAHGLAGQWASAVTGYRAALALFPDDYATQFNLAKALEATGDLTGAIAGYERAIVLAPGQADFHLSHGRALEAAKRVTEAVTAYARFLDLAPDAPEADKVKAHLKALGARP